LLTVQISDLVPCPASGQTQAAQCQHRIGLALSKAFVEDRTTYRKTGDFFDILCKQLSDVYGTTMSGCWQALRLQPGLAALLSWRMTMNHW
jgi:hypothetical protein